MRSEWFELKAHEELVLVLIGGAHSTVLMANDGRKREGLEWRRTDRVAVGLMLWGREGGIGRWGI